MSPLASVIIPSYNHGKFIANALESALEQSLSELEVIVIDDGSTDNSLNVLSSYHDPRLSVYKNPKNIGPSASLNLGLSKAKAPFIAILNSDDLYEPNRLIRCITLLEEQSADLIGTDLHLINDEGSVIEDPEHWWYRWLRATQREFEDSLDITSTLFKGNFFVSTSNFVLRRSLLEEIGSFENQRYTQDYAFLFKALRNGVNRVLWLPEKLMRYRLHKENTITEERIAPVEETILLLSRELPIISEYCDHLRCWTNYEEHLNRLISYLREGAFDEAKIKMEAKVQALQSCIDAQNGCILSMQSHADTQKTYITELQACIDGQTKHNQSIQFLIDGQSEQILNMQSVIDGQSEQINYQIICIDDLGLKIDKFERSRLLNRLKNHFRQNIE